MALAAVWFAVLVLSRFHLPILLGSTVITRFIATMRTLTPALLLPAPGQASLIHEPALPDIPSPITPCAPAPTLLWLRTGFAERFAWVSLIAGSSDFAHC